ncbi:MAG: HU family DNA-binding protein [Tannerellaceae bacterium]|nr:HU family DNA-binding protein [Tannerellaceae bacterium]
MALKYKIYPVKNNQLTDGEPCYAVSLLRGSNVNLQEIAEYMNVLSSFSPGDVTGLVDNLVVILSRYLAEGNSVTLDGLGTFSLSAGLKRPVSDPEQITGNDICIRRICFKPTPDFKARVEEKANFQKHVPLIKYKPEE